MIQTINDYIDKGLSVIPVKIGSKAPAINTWRDNMKARMTKDEFSLYDTTRVGIIGGVVSGGLECLDFDNHFGDAEEIFHNYMNNMDVIDLTAKYNFPVQKTASGGYHLVYKAENVEGSKKLARRVKDDGKPDCLIETRGEGGYFVAYPSEGYEQIHGDWSSIPTITAEERNTMILAAKGLNEFVKDVPTPKDNKRAGDDYDEKATESEVVQMLKNAGWTDAGGKQWIRPNKKRGTGVSATLGMVAPKIFYVFSSNGYPFEENKPYSPFGVYAELICNGDYARATKELTEQGYGEFTPDANYNSGGGGSNGDGGNKKPTKRDKMQMLDKFIQENIDVRQNKLTRVLEMSLGDLPYELFDEDVLYNAVVDGGSSLSKPDILSRIRGRHIRSFHPFEEYFKELPKWDREDRLSQLCASVKAEENESQWYTESMIRKALVRQYRCAVSSSVNREVIILVSPVQRSGKTYFCQWIAPMTRTDYADADMFNSGYTTETQVSKDKDVKIAMAQNFTFIIDETDKLNKTEMSTAKSLITLPTVNERLPYGKQPELMRRTCTFWGTSNETSFLARDPNTRWIPLYIDAIDWDYRHIDKDQLWSQVVEEYKELGEAAMLLNDEEKKMHSSNNEDAVIETEEDQLISRYFEPCDSKKMLNHEIRTKAAELAGLPETSINPQKFASAFKRLGYRSFRAASGRGYYLKIKTIKSYASSTEN